MKGTFTVASRSGAGIPQAIIVLMAGVFLAIVTASGPPLLLLAGLFSVLFFIVFLRRPDLGLLGVLFARASSDLALTLTSSGSAIAQAEATSGLRGLLLNPNTALILILICAGAVVILIRRLPILGLPGGALLLLLPLSGIVGVVRSEDIFYSLQEWVPMLAAPITYALAAGLFREPAEIHRVPKVLAASFLLPAIVGYSQLLTRSGVLAQGFIRIYGTFVHPNPFGLYLVVVTAVFVPLAFLRSRMGLISRAIVLAVGPLLLGTYARFAWAGAVIVLLCVGIFRHRILLLILPLIGVVALMPVVQERVEDPFGGSFADRLSIWSGVYRQWLVEAKAGGTASSAIVSIVGGLGPGAAALLAARFRGNITLAHNDYVRLLVDHGIVGLVFYILLALTMIRLGYQAYRASKDRPSGAIALGFLALAIAYPIMSFTSNIIAATVNQLYFWALAGLCVSMRGTSGRLA